MSPNEALVAVVALVGVLGAPVAAMYLWLHRPAAQKAVPGRTDNSALEARLERIELAVQAIALETERIAEGQRFTTKLLTAPEGSRDSRNVVPRV